MGDNSVIFQGISIMSESDVVTFPPRLLGISIMAETNVVTYPPTFIGVSITVPYFISPKFPTPPKKVYMTNKGNIMVNPNDTVLIEVN